MAYKKRLLARANLQSAKRQRISRPMSISPELKYFVASTTLSSTVYAGRNLLGTLVRGTDRDQRIGDTIRIKKIELTIATGAENPPFAKHWMYSRNGNVSTNFDPLNLTIEPDSKDYRVWSRKAPCEYPNLVAAATGTSPVTVLRKTFSSPMKVTFNNSTTFEEQMNGIYLTSVVAADPFLDITGPIDGRVNIRVWYYDF